MAIKRSDTKLIPASLRSVLDFLLKIEGLQLPPASQREMEYMLTSQASVMMESLTRHNPGHGRRTAHYCVVLGRTLGLPPDELHDLALAGLLHDIGLLMLDPEFLARRDHWDTDDYARAQSHPRAGAELLNRFAFLTSAAHVIAHHHERWDGCGYPFGLRGSFIPIGARMLAIADSFDAIQIPHEPNPDIRRHVALRILEVAAGSQFDPVLVRAFACVIRNDRADGNRRHGSDC